MRHRVAKNLRLNHRDQGHLNAITRNLITSFFTHTSLVTTEKKAKILTREVDRLMRIAHGQAEDMNKIRSISATVFTDEASRAAMRIAKHHEDKKSGFTRITPMKYRIGDAAKLVKIELISA